MSTKRTASSKDNSKNLKQQVQDGFDVVGAQRAPANPQLLENLQAEVSDEAAPLLQFIMKHAGVIVGCLVLFVLVLGGVGAYNWHTESKMLEAQENLSSIVLSKQGAERISALEEFLSTAPSSLESGVRLAIAQTAMELKEYEKAATNFGKLASLDAQGAVGLLSALNQGQALLLAGKAKDAVAVLEPIVNKAPSLQKTVIQQSLAEAFIQAGEIEKARQTFEAMAAGTEGPEAKLFRYRARTLGNGAEKAVEKTEDKPSN